MIMEEWHPRPKQYPGSFLYSAPSSAAWGRPNLGDKPYREPSKEQWRSTKPRTAPLSTTEILPRPSEYTGTVVKGKRKRENANKILKTTLDIEEEEFGRYAKKRAVFTGGRDKIVATPYGDSEFPFVMNANPNGSIRPVVSAPPVSPPTKRVYTLAAPGRRVKPTTEPTPSIRQALKTQKTMKELDEAAQQVADEDKQHADIIKQYEELVAKYVFCLGEYNRYSSPADIPVIDKTKSPPVITTAAIRGSSFGNKSATRAFIKKEVSPDSFGTPQTLPVIDPQVMFVDGSNLLVGCISASIFNKNLGPHASTHPQCHELVSKFKKYITDCFTGYRPGVTVMLWDDSQMVAWGKAPTQEDRREDMGQKVEADMSRNKYEGMEAYDARYVSSDLREKENRLREISVLIGEVAKTMPFTKAQPYLEELKTIYEKVSKHPHLDDIFQLGNPVPQPINDVYQDTIRGRPALIRFIVKNLICGDPLKDSWCLDLDPDHAVIFVGHNFRPEDYSKMTNQPMVEYLKNVVRNEIKPICYELRMLMARSTPIAACKRDGQGWENIKSMFSLSSPLSKELLEYGGDLFMDTVKWVQGGDRVEGQSQQPGMLTLWDRLITARYNRRRSNPIAASQMDIWPVAPLFNQIGEADQIYPFFIWRLHREMTLVLKHMSKHIFMMRFIDSDVLLWHLPTLYWSYQAKNITDFHDEPSKWIHPPILYNDFHIDGMKTEVCNINTMMKDYDFWCVDKIPKLRDNLNPYNTTPIVELIPELQPGTLGRLTASAHSTERIYVEMQKISSEDRRHRNADEALDYEEHIREETQEIVNAIQRTQENNAIKAVDPLDWVEGTYLPPYWVLIVATMYCGNDFSDGIPHVGLGPIIKALTTYYPMIHPLVIPHPTIDRIDRGIRPPFVRMDAIHKLAILAYTKSRHVAGAFDQACSPAVSLEAMKFKGVAKIAQMIEEKVFDNLKATKRPKGKPVEPGIDLKAVLRKALKPEDDPDDDPLNFDDGLGEPVAKKNEPTSMVWSLSRYLTPEAMKSCRKANVKNVLSNYEIFCSGHRLNYYLLSCSQNGAGTIYYAPEGCCGYVVKDQSRPMARSNIAIDC